MTYDDLHRVTIAPGSYPGLTEAINAAGHNWENNGGNWYASNPAAVQAIIDTYNPVPYLRTVRIAALKADGLARINATFPAIASLDEVAFYAEFWLSVAAAARAPTAAFKKVIDIYSAAKAAITSVNAATTQAQIDAVNPAWPA